MFAQFVTLVFAVVVTYSNGNYTDGITKSAPSHMYWETVTTWTAIVLHYFVPSTEVTEKPTVDPRKPAPQKTSRGEGRCEFLPFCKHFPAVFYRLSPSFWDILNKTCSQIIICVFNFGHSECPGGGISWVCSLAVTDNGLARRTTGSQTSVWRHSGHLSHCLWWVFTSIKKG